MKLNFTITDRNLILTKLFRVIIFIITKWSVRQVKLNGLIFKHLFVNFRFSSPHDHANVVIISE